MLENIEEFNKYVLTVDNSANYWMVRTMGGEYYEEFVENNFVAIGYNDILLREINSFDGEERDIVHALKSIVAERHEEVLMPGHVASQLVRFCRTIKKGDILVVPGWGSCEISICRVTGEVYEEPNVRDDNGLCPFMKRLPVEILKSMNRRALSPKAQLMFNSRHPISDISDYAVYIDNICHDYYCKEDETHIVLNIETQEDVTMPAFYNLQKLFDIAEAFCKENGISGEAKDVVMKVQMESPGILHFISKNKNFLFLIGILVLFINGGGLKIDRGSFKLDLSTDGILRNISEFMDRNTDRELRESIKASMDSLQIKTPEDFQKAMINLYKVQNENRKEY